MTSFVDTESSVLISLSFQGKLIRSLLTHRKTSLASLSNTPSGNDPIAFDSNALKKRSQTVIQNNFICLQLKKRL